MARADTKSRMSQAARDGWAIRKAKVTALEERCAFLETAWQAEQERVANLRELHRLLDLRLGEKEVELACLMAQVRQRTRVAQQYFDAARNLGLGPGGEQAEPWLLEREER